MRLGLAVDPTSASTLSELNRRITEEHLDDYARNVYQLRTGPD
jgi:hypothetical protein